MDTSLMTDEEIERRGRVIVEPCYVCGHNRQIHVLEMIASYSVHGEMNVREIPDACVACRCLEFTSPPPEPEHYLGDGHEHRDEESGHAAFVDEQHDEFLERTAGSALIPDAIADQLSANEPDSGEPQ